MELDEAVEVLVDQLVEADTQKEIETIDKKLTVLARLR